MTDPSHLSDEERADLVSYLDGELTGEDARALEAKLSLDARARSEADSLRRTWELLDYLPRPQPSPNFTHRTMQRLPPVQAREQQRRHRWRTRGFALAWAASLLLAGWGGYAGYSWVDPGRPGDRELMHDLRLIENKRFYNLVENLDFWRALDKPELFGDDASSS
jgi:anti-sigma factor RsiW